MGIKKETPERVTSIRRLEVMMGFINGGRGLSQMSKKQRCPGITKLLDCIQEICIEFSSNATSDSLSTNDKLMVRVQKLLDDLGPALWPDSVAPWASDPSDHKQQALSKFAKDYPKQLRYSHPLERAR
jgi:hypothetical protein